jgi:hypothetical protein
MDPLIEVEPIVETAEEKEEEEESGPFLHEYV